MALNNQYSQTLLRNFVILVVLFIAMLLLSSVLFYSSFKEKTFESAKFQYETQIKYFSELITKKIVLTDMESIFELTDEVNKSDYIKNVKIDLKRFVFSKDTLLFKTPSFNDKTWELGNIEIDVKYGTIINLKNSYFYEFIPSPNFDIQEDLIIRYQAYKGQEIKNFITKLNFLVQESVYVKVHENIAPDLVSFIYDEDFDADVNKIDLDGLTIGSVSYEFDDTITNYEIYSFLLKLFIYTLVVFLPILIVINFYQKYVYKNYVLKPIGYLNDYMNNILEHKFKKIENKRFEDIEDFKSLTDNITKVSSSMASLVNELNISKETLERKLSTDNLTGLANKKTFELDIKSMFVSSSEAYIMNIKIENLKMIKSSNKGDANHDEFIQSFANSINDTVHKYKKLDVKFYRFFGLEFYMIIKKINFDECEKIVKNILDNLENKLSGSYSLPNNFANVSGIPFDSYGSLFSIIENTKTTYEEIDKSMKNNFLIKETIDSNEEVNHLEENVKDIIDNKKFSIEFIADTYSLYDSSIIMKELKPILLDEDNNEIPIGSFVSISEKLNKVIEFDTEVILKALSFIQENKIDYKIAVNLSIDTISSNEFYKFISKIVDQTSLLNDNIIFSITSYTASLNKSRFVSFVKRMNEFNIEVLLKRYQTNEISLEDLSSIKLSYIRMHKEYTNNISSDLVKKHKIKNIIIFGELNDIKILGDSVHEEKDYGLLDRLDLYGTSK
jgi:EAL domain-containing protein (putative c-di-GMP-specific phosphodiesterase class I)